MCMVTNLRVFERMTLAPASDEMARMHGGLARLSKRDMLALALLSYQAGRAASLDAGQEVLHALKAIVPVDAALCALVRLDARIGALEVQALLAVDWPAEWLALYRHHRYDRVDPVLRIHFAHYAPQVWSHTYQNVSSWEERQFIEISGGFGLRDGITLGMACGGPRAGSVLSFVGEDLVHEPRYQTMLEYLTPALHSILVRVAGCPPRAPLPLTAREREVLQWAGLGKTTWEIARIVGISERTVVFHFRNVMRKLKARNRVQAVAQAAALGLFSDSP